MRLQRRCVFRTAACVCLVLLMFRQGLADGVIRDGVGARVSGRGGTNIGFSDSGEILLDNPAGMVNVPGRGLTSFGVDLLVTDLKYGDPANPLSSSADNPLPMGQGSVIWKTTDDVWAFGFGVYAPAGFGAEYSLNGPAPLGGRREYKSFGSLGRILGGVSSRLTERLSAGFSVGLAVSHTELEGPYFLQSPGPFQGAPLMLDLQATGVAPSWSLGLQYELTEQTTLGLTYQSSNDFELDGGARITTPVLGLGSGNYDAQLGMEWPQSVGGGVRHKLTPTQTIAMDVIWYDWSSAFDEFELVLSGPSAPAFLAVLGPRVVERLPMRWRDSVSFRFGYEQELEGNRTVRLGYVYHRNPIPDSTLSPYIQAILEHTLAAGYGWQMGKWEVDIAYQFMFGPNQGVNTSGLIGGDFSGSRHESRAHFAYLSFLRQF